MIRSVDDDEMKLFDVYAVLQDEGGQGHARIVMMLTDGNATRLHALIPKSIPCGRRVFARDEETGESIEIGIVARYDCAPYVYAIVNLHENVAPYNIQLPDLDCLDDPYISADLWPVEMEDRTKETAVGFLSDTRRQTRLSFAFDYGVEAGNRSAFPAYRAGSVPVPDMHIAELSGDPHEAERLIGSFLVDAQQRLIGIVVGVNPEENYAVLAQHPSSYTKGDFDDYEILVEDTAFQLQELNESLLADYKERADFDDPDNSSQKMTA